MHLIKFAAKSVSLAMLCVIAVGCSSLPLTTEQVSVFNNTRVPAPKLLDGALEIADVKLAPWRMPLPNCENCVATVHREFAPSGASHIVQLVQNESVVWAFVDSKQNRFKTAIGTLLINDNAITLQHETFGELSLAPGESTQVHECKITYLWRNEPYPIESGVSNENPNAHAQLLFDCL